jgi:LysM repeat protein
MNKEQTYHIDVSEEESQLFIDQPPKQESRFVLPKFSKLFKLPKISKFTLSFPKVFCIILGAHIILACALFGTSSKASAKEEDKKALNEPFPSPTPNVAVQEPVPKVSSKSLPKSATTPSAAVSQKAQSKFTEKYVVKQGDTFDKIVKQYKLNSEKLKQINNIKDSNKITVGQTLKFM